MQLTVIIASTRPGRKGKVIGDWFVERAEADGRFELDVVDLADLGLPFLDEPKHPRLREYTHQHTKDWSARVDAAEAFVVVHPEYNYAVNAPLKNAFDFLHHEWAGKPIGFVSYGGRSSGLRAVENIRSIAGALKMFPVEQTVAITLADAIDDDGTVKQTDALNEAARLLLDAMARITPALSESRPTKPG